MNRLLTALMMAFLVFWSVPAAAQPNEHPFRLGGQMATVSSGEFESDIGFGALFSWAPTALVGFDAEINFFPEDLGEVATFSQNRMEGLFGMTVGPTLGRLRPFAKVRPGFLSVEGSPGPIPCITIYPAPLTCTLAGGDTLFALDLGGGVELFPSGRSYLRLDVSDRMVQYPGPALDADFELRENSFWGHDFRFTIGAGVRF